MIDALITAKARPTGQAVSFARRCIANMKKPTKLINITVTAKADWGVLSDDQKAKAGAPNHSGQNACEISRRTCNSGAFPPNPRTIAHTMAEKPMNTATVCATPPASTNKNAHWVGTSSSAICSALTSQVAVDQSTAVTGTVKTCKENPAIRCRANATKASAPRAVSATKVGTVQIAKYCCHSDRG